MAGVAKGTKRGPYQARTKPGDLTELKMSANSYALSLFLDNYDDELIVVLRKAVRCQKLNVAQIGSLKEFYDRF